MFNAIIMAAGKGTRMKSLDQTKSKVAFELLGVPLVQYVLDAVKPLKLDQIITIVGFAGEATQAIVGAQSKVVWQREQKGTGHAIMQCAPLLEQKDGVTLILSGDTPLLTTETLQKLLENHQKNSADLTILTAVLDNPKGYGRIIRNGALVSAIVEQADATEEQQKIKEVNTGVYIFNNRKLFDEIKNLKPNNKQGEYYLTDVLRMFVQKKFKVGAEILTDAREMYGINDRVQLAEASLVMQLRINDKWMRAGVTIERPEQTMVGPYAVLGADTVIKPGSMIIGKSIVGNGNSIGPNTTIIEGTIGNNNTIEQSKIIHSKLGDGNHVGPFSHIREEAVIHHQTRIGNFVEIKKSILHDGVKCAHLSYVGDTEIFENTNVGAGVIVANYDGKNKHRTTIGKNVFIGSGVTLIAPITIGDNVILAAGSTITDDVPSGDMGIARNRQTNKKGFYEVWKKKIGKE